MAIEYNAKALGKIELIETDCNKNPVTRVNAHCTVMLNKI